MRWLVETISLKVSAILPMRPGRLARHAHREIAHAHGLQGAQQVLQIATFADAVVERGGMVLERDVRAFALTHLPPQRAATGYRQQLESENG